MTSIPDLSYGSTHGPFPSRFVFNFNSAVVTKFSLFLICSLFLGGNPTTVTVSLYILSIGNFQVRDMVSGEGLTY